MNICSDDLKQHHLEMCSRKSSSLTAGTGTVTGDKTEVQALGQHFKNTPTAKAQGIYIGSTKTNIGHLESAAGVCGLIKVCLMMKNETIVPSLFYSKEKANQELKLDCHKLIVPTATIHWTVERNSTRYACVNSFGFGGSNSHIAVRQIRSKSKKKLTKHRQKFLTIITSQTKAGLAENVEDFCRELSVKSDISLTDICYTTLCARDHFNEKVVVAASTKEELKESLEKKINGLNSHKKQTKLVFVYCGVGTTWKGMCTELLKIKPFRATVENISNMLMKYTDLSIIEKWERNDDLSDSLVAHLSIFVCQVGLTELWKLYGVHPQAVVGQSIGEVAAAYCAGYLDLDSAVRLIYHRSKELQKAEGGGMIVVRNVAVEQVERICKEVTNVNVAVYLSPISCTVAGEASALMEVRHRLERSENGIQKGPIKIDNLDVTCAYHSPLVYDAGCTIAQIVGDVESPKRQTEISFSSSVYGTTATREDVLQNCYWQKNVTEPVRFYQAIEALADTSFDVCFLEIGPAPVLKAHIRDIFPDDNRKTVITSMKRSKDRDSLLLAIAELGSGLDIDWKMFYTDFFNDSCQISSIPRYHFQKKKLPHIEHHGKNLRIQKTENANHLYVFDERKTGRIDMKLSISPDRTSFIYEHFVKETIVVPGVTYADVGFEVAERFLGLDANNVILSLEFKAPVILRPDQSVTMDIKTKSLGDAHGSKEIQFGVVYSGNLVCHGKVREKSEDLQKVFIDLESIKTEMPERFDGTEVYSHLSRVGFDYDKSFRIITDGQRNEKEDKCLIRVRIPECIAEDMCKCHIHPCLLDSLLQSSVILTQSDISPFGKQREAVTSQSFPIGIESIEMFETLKFLTSGTILNIFAVHVHHTDLPALRKDHYDVKLVDNDGHILAAITNLVIYTKAPNVKACDDLKYQLKLAPVFEPVNYSIKSSDDTSKNKQRILLIDGSDCFKKEIAKLVDSYTIIQIESARSHGQSMQDILTSSFSDLLVFFSPGNENIDDSASDVLEHVSKNCMLLQRVLQVSNAANIFIITVGVYQHIEDTENHKAPSVYGAEVWGFFRSAEIEFIHPRVVIIDIDSVSKETVTTLYKLTQTVGSKPSIQESEYCINKSQIFGLRLSKCTKMTKTPLLRSTRVSSKFRKMFLRSCRTNKIADPFYIAVEGNPTYTTDIKGEKTLTLYVEKVFAHDYLIFSVTRSEHPLTSEINYTTGFQVIAVEVVGKSLKTRTPELTFDDSKQFIACYPCNVSNIIQVPEECCIELSQLANYQPGLLFSCMYFWTLIEEIPYGANVYVCASDSLFSHPTSILLLKLLARLKQCSSVKQSTSMQITDSTVTLVLRPLDRGEYAGLRRCAKVIFPVQFFTAEWHDKLLIDAGLDVKLIDARAIFSVENIKSLMPKVVKWLQNEYDLHFIDEDVIRSQKYWQDAALNGNTVIIRESTAKYFWYQKVTDKKVPANMLFNIDSVYVVVGGLTGVGWWMVKILAKYGAGKIITFGRRQSNKENQIHIDNLTNLYRCHIRHMAVDVTDYRSVYDAFAEIRSDHLYPTISGIFHGAGVLDSVLVRAQTEKRLKRVLTPKVVGTVNLHRVSKGLNLDYFVMTSSIASLIGSPGQSNYGAANAFMDSLANWRRSQGLAAQSVNWGAIGAGMAAEEKTAKELEKRGHQLLNEEEFESCFIQSLLTNESTVGYAKIIHEKMKSGFDNERMRAVSTKMEFLWEEDFMIEKEPVRDSTYREFYTDLVSKGQKELRDRLEEILTHLCKKILGDISDKLNMSESYVSLGADSMSSINLSNVLKDTTGHIIPSEKFLDPTFTLQDTLDVLCAQFESTDL